MNNRNVHAVLQRAAVNTSHGDTPRIIGVVETCDQKLRRSLIHGRSRYFFQNLVQQVVDIVRRRAPVSSHPVVFGRTIHNGEIELFLRSIEVAHEVEYHFVHFLGAAVGFVHLVDHHDRLQSDLQGFLEHEARLRHRAFKGIDEQDTAVGHIEYALHLSTKVGVARSINNIYFSAFIVDRDILGENGDTSLSLQLIIIED